MDTSSCMQNRLGEGVQHWHVQNTTLQVVLLFCSELLANSAFLCWIILHETNLCQVFCFLLPDFLEEQHSIAVDFQKVSTSRINFCADAIIGIWIWTLKPSIKKVKEAGVGQKKFTKDKFGLNCKSASDCRAYILDTSVNYGSASADCLALEASYLHYQLLIKTDSDKDRFVPFGGNNYLNTSYTATPFANISGNLKMKSIDN